MNYFNPTIGERISHSQLCDKFNASIPSSLEEYEGWYKLAYAPYPTAEEYQIVKQNADPELIDDKWTITYTVEDTPIELLRSRKMTRLKNEFDHASSSAYVKSSLGFTIDANDVANRNIQGLITTLEDTGTEFTQFCDHENVFHNVSLADFKVMRLEIIRNGQYLYQQKWAYRDQINTIDNVAELSKLEITFENLSFSTAE